jgi:hypothetical protein
MDRVTQGCIAMIGVLLLVVGYFYMCNKDLKKKIGKMTDVLQSMISRPAPQEPKPQPQPQPSPPAPEPQPEEVEYEEVEVEEEEGEEES